MSDLLHPGRRSCKLHDSDRCRQGACHPSYIDGEATGTYILLSKKLRNVCRACQVISRYRQRLVCDPCDAPRPHLHVCQKPEQSLSCVPLSM